MLTQSSVAKTGSLVDAAAWDEHRLFLGVRKQLHAALMLHRVGMRVWVALNTTGDVSENMGIPHVDANNRTSK